MVPRGMICEYSRFIASLIVLAPKPCSLSLQTAAILASLLIKSLAFVILPIGFREMLKNQKTNLAIKQLDNMNAQQHQVHPKTSKASSFELIMNFHLHANFSIS